MVTIEQVKKYWEEHPLLSFEVDDMGSDSYFDKLNQIKNEDVELFSQHFWEFNKFQGKKVLDVGCGPGWLTVNYAFYGAEVYAIDLTQSAVVLTKKHLAYKRLSADVKVGNAECLEFKDDRFDLLVSSGVLHHTPDTYKALKECHRVLKPGGVAKISLYIKGFLHNELLFPFLKYAMEIFNIRHPGGEFFEAKDVDDFIRRYDGSGNPYGIGKSIKDWKQLLLKAGFDVKKHELHYFPKRLIPFGFIIQRPVHYFLDKYFGTMIYFELNKTK